MAQVKLETVPDGTTITMTKSGAEAIGHNTHSKKRCQEEVQTCDPDDETRVVATASIIPAVQGDTQLKKKAKKATSRDDSRQIEKSRWVGPTIKHHATNNVAATGTPTPVSLT